MAFQLRDLTTIEPSSGGSFELLPKGDYMLEISEVGDEKPTRNGDGTCASLKFTVVGGEHDGGGFYANYNIQNKSEKAMEISWRELSAIGHAVGVFDGDADKLLYKQFMAKVGIEKSTNPAYPNDKNKIDKVYQDGERPASAPPAPAPRAVPTPVARPAAVSGARPWPKRA